MAPRPPTYPTHYQLQPRRTLAATPIPTPIRRSPRTTAPHRDNQPRRRCSASAATVTTYIGPLAQPHRQRYGSPAERSAEYLREAFLSAFEVVFDRSRWVAERRGEVRDELDEGLAFETTMGVCGNEREGGLFDSAAGVHGSEGEREELHMTAVVVGYEDEFESSAESIEALVFGVMAGVMDDEGDAESLAGGVNGLMFNAMAGVRSSEGEVEREDREVFGEVVNQLDGLKVSGEDRSEAKDETE